MSQIAVDGGFVDPVDLGRTLMHEHVVVLSTGILQQGPGTS